MVVGLLAAFAGEAAVVYKWTDADGVVHYSDQPVPGAVKIDTGTGPARNGTSFGAAPSAASTSAKNGVSSPQAYTLFEIGSPAHEQSFFGDDPVNAHLSLEPSLLPNHSITWLLNGTPVENQSPDAVSITLKNLPRGNYTISASVADRDTGDARSTEAVNFYVKEPSLLSPQHKNP
jgi:hypothetical protein